jgi:hypothetical protein
MRYERRKVMIYRGELVNAKVQRPLDARRSALFAICFESYMKHDIASREIPVK